MALPECGYGAVHPGHLFEKARTLARTYRRALLWPAAVLLLAAIGWVVLLVNLDNQKRVHEETALREAAILSRAYANHLNQSLAAIDQITLYIKYAWEFSNGMFRLEGIDTASSLLSNSGFYVAIIDRDGEVITSISPLERRANARNEPFFLAQKNAAQDHFHIGKVRNGIFTNRTVVQFSRMLVDGTGQFDGIVLVSVVPDYFIAGYDEITLGKNGLLAILGTDGSIRVTRVGKTVFKPSAQAVVAAPPLEGLSGTAFLAGDSWFSDMRNRYAGWQVTNGYGMMVIAGLDQEAVLEPYLLHRAASLRNATWASIAVAALVLTAMLLSLRLARKQGELDGLRATYRMATEGGSEGFYIARPLRASDSRIIDFEVIDCNHRGAELVNLRREELVGKRVSHLCRSDAAQAVIQSLGAAFESGVHEAEKELPSDSLIRARWVHVRIVRSGEDLAVTLRDISDVKAHVVELEKRGNEDALTGLPNRHWVKDFLPQAVKRTEEQGRRLAVLFIDLDGFKAVNDTMGHEAGDELLRNAGRRLKVAVRPHDHVVRIGGDEFVVILEDIADKAAVSHVAERILAAFKETFRLSQGVHSIGTSIGVSIFPDDAANADTLLKHADVAMYSVKTSGKQSYRFFDQRYYESVRIRHEREAELRHAIEHNQFVVYYQPRIDMSTGTMSSMEALVRWAHPTRGIIEPVEFIPMAEETGLILPLGEWVIDRVCAQLAYWSRHGRNVLPVSINVSPRQFHETKLPDVLSRLMARHKVDPKLVEIELTESSMMDVTEKIFETLDTIQSMGIKLLVDDFGTGYSSLSKLQELDFDVLKVDKAFTARLQKTTEGQALFTAIITMAHSLGMRVVAEGVESVEQVETLKSLRCDEVQGFYISRPLPPAETQPVFENWAMPAIA